MKLFFIKIGKAWNVLRRDGFANGGRRIVSAFFSLFRFVGKGDILFVTGGVGDSALYRAHHTAEELELQGFKCSITVQDNPMLSGYAGKFKVFIFHRVLFTPNVAKLLENIKNQDKEIIFEADDLVYDPKYLRDMDYFQKLNSLEKKLYENGVGGEILSDPYVKTCTTTTTYLANKLSELGKKVFIVSNKLSKKDVQIAEKVISYKLSVKNKKLPVNSYPLSNPGNRLPITDNKNIRIGYFSGTISHNKDFATITDALSEVMEKHQDVELFLVGPLETENKLNKFSDRIKQFPYVPREKHFKNIASVDINVAPLERDNPFCESKSELKFFEAGIVGVPTVAVANRTFSEAISDGVDGFVAKDTDEWVSKLEKLILDEKLREEMGKKAREKALKLYTTENAKNEGYYEYLRSRIY
ncbi:MAG TPA: hypothetical protein DCX32_02660 [Candidatus Moranbacteria bacterium]|nr:hypothetical protein [Candidatus Moranbacteria bacterium]